MNTEDEYTLKRRLFDKGPFKYHFQFLAMVLGALGLNVYTAVSFCLGAATAVGVFYWLLSNA